MSPEGVAVAAAVIGPMSQPRLEKLSFTEYVRDLGPEGKPAPEAFDRLQRRLRGALVVELKRRSLWYLSPRCLGIFGLATWQEEGAVDELVADCYRFVFVHRLGSLRSHLRVKSNIDGLVFRSIHNYLYDAQKKHDPLGFRVFSVLQLAVRRCCDDGRLHVLAGDERVRNDTVLGFRAGADPSTELPRGLARRVASWNDDLLPELVTARGKRLDRLTGRLARHVGNLREGDFEVFSFAGVLEPLKDDARRRWNAIWSHSSEGVAGDSGARLEGWTRWVPPDTDYEQRQAFEWLARCVSQRLEGLYETPRDHDRLRRLWAFLRHQVTEESDLKMASRRRISGLLEIPRDSLSNLYATLGRLIRGCQDSSGAVHEMEGRP